MFKQENEKNDRDKKKKYLIFFLLLAIIPMITGGAYAYWAGNISNPVTPTTKKPQITIGKANDVTTTLTVSDPTSEVKKLVPAGKVEFSEGGSANNTDTFSQSFNVNWKDETKTVKSDDNVSGNLNVTATPHIANGESYSNLVKVTINSTPKTIKLNDSNPTVVTVTVTLTEPQTKEAYDAIVNQIITVDLNFTVTK